MTDDRYPVNHLQAKLTALPCLQARLQAVQILVLAGESDMSVMRGMAHSLQLIWRLKLDEICQLLGNMSGLAKVSALSALTSMCILELPSLFLTICSVSNP